MFKLFHFREENLAKINKRVSDYKVEIRNPPRPGKKLLVLDVDYTIFGKSTQCDCFFEIINCPLCKFQGYH